LFDKHNPNTGIFDWQRHCCLAFDFMTCKGSFVVNYHTYIIVGLESDSLQSDMIFNELKEIELKDKMSEQLEEEKKTEQEKCEVHELDKHVLIFTCPIPDISLCV
jgi:hypothetical protein